MFSSDVYENSHINVHYIADDQYYIKNGFLAQEELLHVFLVLLHLSTLFTVFVLDVVYITLVKLHK